MNDFFKIYEKPIKVTGYCEELDLFEVLNTNTDGYLIIKQKYNCEKDFEEIVCKVEYDYDTGHWVFEWDYWEGQEEVYLLGYFLDFSYWPDNLLINILNNIEDFNKKELLQGYKESNLQLHLENQDLYKTISEMSLKHSNKESELKEEIKKLNEKIKFKDEEYTICFDKVLELARENKKLVNDFLLFENKEQYEYIERLRYTIECLKRCKEKRKRHIEQLEYEIFKYKECFDTELDLKVQERTKELENVLREEDKVRKLAQQEYIQLQNKYDMLEVCNNINIKRLELCVKEIERLKKV